MLNLSSFEKAIHQLKQSLEYYHSDLVQQDPNLALQLQAAAIQAFEFTYELSWKMLKRYLEVSLPSTSELRDLSFPDLIRTGCEQGLLLSDFKAWKAYREERNITSHAYDSAKANEIFLTIPSFLQEAEYLLKQLQQRQ